MYFITPEQYHEDTKFIRDIEEALLGNNHENFEANYCFRAFSTSIWFTLYRQCKLTVQTILNFSGSFVVVRDNSDGLYRRGMVTRATGRSYEISLNGDTILQVRNS